MALFERGPLEQDTGLIKDRWGQEGSVVVNAEGYVQSPLTSATIHTVTSGKTCYISDLWVQVTACSGGANGALQIRDGAGGSDIIVITTDNYSGGEVVNFNLKTPIVFTDNVRMQFNASGTCSARLAVSGWEE